MKLYLEVDEISQAIADYAAKKIGRSATFSTTFDVTIDKTNPKASKIFAVVEVDRPTSVDTAL